MRAKQRAKCAELEPTHVELAGKFLGRNKTSRIGTPEWNSAKASVDADGNVGAQSFPRGVDIAGPEEGRVTLHARIAIAMQRVRPLVWPIELRSFVVHSNSR